MWSQKLSLELRLFVNSQSRIETFVNIIGKFILKNLASSPATANYKAQWAPSLYELFWDADGFVASALVRMITIAGGTEMQVWQSQ